MSKHQSNNYCTLPQFGLEGLESFDQPHMRLLDGGYEFFLFIELDDGEMLISRLLEDRDEDGVMDGEVSHIDFVGGVSVGV